MQNFADPRSTTVDDCFCLNLRGFLRPGVFEIDAPQAVRSTSPFNSSARFADSDGEWSEIGAAVDPACGQPPLCRAKPCRLTRTGLSIHTPGPWSGGFLLARACCGEGDRRRHAPRPRALSPFRRLPPILGSIAPSQAVGPRPVTRSRYPGPGALETRGSRAMCGGSSRP